MPLPLTLIHVSDLHIGVPCAEDAAPPPDGWPLFDGTLGHSYNALVALTEFVDWERALNGTENVALVVTGDLTACGREDEFRMAAHFLKCRFKLGAARVGLEARDVYERTIPGNHDHWPGLPWPAGLGLAVEDHFFIGEDVLPMAPFDLTLGNGRILKLIGINTDAGVHPASPARTLARGSFVGQLEALRAEIAPGAEAGHEVRVLLLHHSPEYAPHGDPLLRIDRRSLRALHEFIAWARVRVMLTGHIHTCAGTWTAARHGGESWNVVEVRCGTSTQVTRPPRLWRRLGKIPPKLAYPNNLVVHRIEEDGDDLVWTAEAYNLRERQFVRAGGVPLRGGAGIPRAFEMLRPVRIPRP